MRYLDRKRILHRMTAVLGVFLAVFFGCPGTDMTASAEQEKGEDVRALYQAYCARLDAVRDRQGISDNGFAVEEDQIFPIVFGEDEEAYVIPAFDRTYRRLALFVVDAQGNVLYKTEQLETNNRIRGQMEQPNRGIAAISFQDLDADGRMDIVLITYCANDSGTYAGKPYKVGDVLFQDAQGTGFYRDYRIADKINRFGMNKSSKLIAAFVRDGYSTEFLYTAATLDELLREGFEIITEQSHVRTFGKLGRLQVVPGTYHIADFDVFMVYLVNDEGYIVSSLQPMGKYDNLYALKGINCRDIDGDGLKDIVVLARYSYESEERLSMVETDYTVYYQRTGGFSVDMDIKDTYPCSEEDTMESVIEKARAYWGWRTEP